MEDFATDAGSCARMCPLGANSDARTKSRFGSKKLHTVMGCINRCPQRAIQKV
jgi:NAD-dependent dihydropyrimidine dehydrogenase PreA subunit